MPREPFQSQLDALFPEGVRVDALLRFRDELLRFNQGRNLISRRGGVELVERLILECSSAASALPLVAGQRVLDLGSGAGFPGIPFALACTVPAQVVLLDRRPVACDFLRREVAELEIGGVEVLEGQSGELLVHHEGLAAGFDWVLMKAVAPPADALVLARPFLGPMGGVALFRDHQFKPSPEMLRGSDDGAPLWEWTGGISIPGFPEAPDAPALQVFRLPR